MMKMLKDEDEKGADEVYQVPGTVNSFENFLLLLLVLLILYYNSYS